MYKSASKVKGAGILNPTTANKIYDKFQRRNNIVDFQGYADQWFPSEPTTPVLYRKDKRSTRRSAWLCVCGAPWSTARRRGSVRHSLLE